jgi:hypothetical protein
MAKKWVEVMPFKADKWNIPQAEITEFVSLTSNASSSLNMAMSNDRTPIVTAHCRADFEALTAKMRYIKSHYFLVPPLTEEDLVSLGLSLPDPNKTPVPKPVNQAGIEIVKWLPHFFGLKLFTAGVVDAAEEEYGIRVYYGLAETGAAPAIGRPSATRLTDDVSLLSGPPQTPKDLPNSFFTKRKKDILDLPPEASGKTCYFAGRYEIGKGREAGPWGTMISAVVP